MGIGICHNAILLLCVLQTFCYKYFAPMEHGWDSKNLQTFCYKYSAPMEHGWDSKIYVYKYSASTVHHWDSKIYKHFATMEHDWDSEIGRTNIYKHFAPTKLGFFYIFSIILDCFCFAQLRRSLTFVTKIITTFKACRRYAIFVILNTHKIDFPHM